MGQYTIGEDRRNEDERIEKREKRQSVYKLNISQKYIAAIAVPSVLCVVFSIAAVASYYSEAKVGLRDQIEQKEYEIADIESRIGMQKEEIVELETQISGQEDEMAAIASLEEKAETLKSDIEGLKEQASTLENDNKTRKEEKADLENENEKLGKDKSALEKNIKKWTSFVSAVRSKANKLGYYSENFNCDKSIVFLKKGESKTVDVYRNFGGTVTNNVGDSNTSSYVTFVWLDPKPMNHHARLNINGTNEGITTIKIYKEDNPSMGFEIMVVVE